MLAHRDAAVYDARPTVWLCAYLIGAAIIILYNEQ